MSLVVNALAGESLDGLVWRAIGQTSGAVELVLAANPGLAASSAALAENTPVTIPDAAQTPASVDLIQLWD